MQTVAPPETLADLVDRLGGIPLQRIRFQPNPGTATEADVLASLDAPRKRLCELIDGVLVEKAMGFTESVLAVFLSRRLDDFVRPRNLGLIAGPDGVIRLANARVRMPDVAYFSWDRLPNRRRPTEPIPSVAPDLAAEILSDGNTPDEMHGKRLDYFAGGVRVVWIIDPALRQVAVYTTPEDSTTLDEFSVLDGGDVLPGFNLPLAELFGELDRQG